MAESAQERKLPPSAQVLRDARRRGQVATSRDLSMAFGMLAATGTLVGTGAVLVNRLTTAVSEGLVRIGRNPTRDLTAEDLVPLLIGGGLLIAMTAGPIALATAGSGVLATLVQTRFLLSMQKLKLHWERLSPANGLKKL